MRILRLRSGRPVKLKYNDTHQLVCCSCGFVHDFVVEKRPGGFFITLWENPGDTDAERGRRCRGKR